MSNTINQPGQDLPDPMLPGQSDIHAIGRPDDALGTGNILLTKSVKPTPAGEPRPSKPNATAQ